MVRQDSGMKEIGSEFWDVPVRGTANGLFGEDCQWYLSGRSALQAIIQDLKGCRTAAMPGWCCDSMIKPFADAGMDIRFYPVWFDGKLRQEPRTDCDILFLMDYFGYTQGQPETAGFRGIVIRDETHSILSRTYDDEDYVFGSFRKWCGVWTGGYARTRDGHPLPEGDEGGAEYIRLRKEAMERKAAYIQGDTTEKDYLAIFAEAETALENTGIIAGAARDIRLMQEADTEQIRRRRRANAEVLREAFPEWLIFPKMEENDCPMFVPIMAPGGRRDELRRYLIRESIYCPVHWPVSAYHRLTEPERVLYDNELSLVCDQRYQRDDMQRMAAKIKEFMEA